MLTSGQHIARNSSIAVSIDAVASFVGDAPIVSARYDGLAGETAALWRHSAKNRTFEGHACDILAVSLRGNSKLEQIDSGRCVWTGPAPGSTVLLRASEPTDWNLTGSFEMLHVYLPYLDQSSSAYKALDRPFRDPVLLQLARSTALGLMESDGKGSYIAPLIESMKRYFNDQYLAELTPSSHSGEGLTGFARRAVSKFIADNMHREITSDDMARVCGLSPSQFGRSFKQSFGFTPHDFLVEQRIGRAAELLCFSEYKVSQVAAMCGFASASHLGVQFKQRIGVTPSVYRKSH